jgi:hypothetical protein
MKMHPYVFFLGAMKLLPHLHLHHSNWTQTIIVGTTATLSCIATVYTAISSLAQQCGSKHKTLPVTSMRN